MRIIIPLLMAALAADVATCAQDKPASLADEYQALEQEFNAAMEDFRKTYGTAKTDAERKKVMQQKLPSPPKYMARMMAIADKDPKDPAAADALIWVFSNIPDDRRARQVLDTLFLNHLESEKMGKLVESLVHRQARDAKKLLLEIRAKNPLRTVQGLATFGLGQLAYSEAGRQKLTPEAEKLFQEVIDKYADVKGTGGALGDQAKRLMGLTNMAAGNPAPEIEGEDIDGKKFKLSDYRGKVVLIDFWGDW